jgi:uncharacterized repeat protein (TIGR03803 family)
MEKVGVLKATYIIFVICAATAIAAPAQTFTSLHSFNGTDGSGPWAGLIQATDGNFYGTTNAGGAYGRGTVFKITTGGQLTTLYSFCSLQNCLDGSTPYAGLVQATDGNFYGTTSGGGIYGQGMVFKITPGGLLTPLHSFDSTDGANPTAGLIQATDGNFYGTTNRGGNGSGTIFKITPEGTLTTLYSFCAQTNCPDGGLPYAGLIQASDGNFYGTTYGYGSVGETVFKITPGGTLTTLYTGLNPYGGLLQASDGNFYGTSVNGGAYGPGAVFKITPEGTLTTLNSFCAKTNCPDGAWPYAGLIQASDGNFYGTTGWGGLRSCFRCGTVFEMSAAGTLGTLFKFNSTDGAHPLAGLVQATDGSFYGTTTEGGTYGYGTVFRLTGGAPAATLSPTSVSFVNQVLNESSAAKTVTLKNSGTALLNLSSIAVDGSSFAISANTCDDAVAMGKTCKVGVTFTPTVVGKVTGTLVLTDTASNSPQIVQLSGTGIGPATLMPTTAFYGTWAVGTISAARTFTLTNNQSAVLTNIVPSTTGDFAVSATTCTTSLAAKGTCTIAVTFTPTATGTRTGRLSVSDSASSSPQSAPLTGTGQLPATVSPGNATYTSQTVGTTSLPKTFTLTNNLTEALTSIVISPTGDFAVSATTCTSSLAAKSNCTISVTFTPTVIGTRRGQLSVSDSASNSPQTANLTGNGT